MGECVALSAMVGSKIWFAEEKRPYHVRAKNMRYLVCTKPFNLKGTTLYTVVDMVRNIRGTENLVLGLGAESDQDCDDMAQRLGTETDVSHRNCIPCRIVRIEHPVAHIRPRK